jgi:hypothetical protein
MRLSNTRGAIRSRYVGPTNHRGSRIIVTDGKDRLGNKHTYHWNYALDTGENHRAAAAEFLEKHNPYAETVGAVSYCFEGDYYHAWESK